MDDAPDARALMISAGLAGSVSVRPALRLRLRMMVLWEAAPFCRARRAAVMSCLALLAELPCSERRAVAGSGSALLAARPMTCQPMPGELPSCWASPAAGGLTC